MSSEFKNISKISRRDVLRLVSAGSAVAMIPGLTANLAYGGQPPAEPAGRIIVGLSQEPTVFNPLMVKIDVDDGVHYSVFDALFRMDPEGIIQPNLATEVPSEENGGISEDGLTWRVKLRDDVSWHDGEPFTAEDVKFTLELINNPKFRSWRTTGHSLIEEIRVISPTEITWKMKEAFSPYLSFLVETFIVPKHILGKEADPNRAAFNQAPVGTGAFKWKRRVAGDHLELVANDKYFGEGPYIEQLVFKYIPDASVLYTQFISGDVDLLGRQYITADNYAEARELPNREVYVVPMPSLMSIYLNLELPQFKELAVREALYAAVDKTSIVEGLFYGLPTPTETFMPRQSYYYNPDLPQHEFNLDRARQILDEAGWKPGPGGVRSKNGVRLAFSNSAPSDDHLRQQMQQFLQQTFAQIGVRMDIQNMPGAVLWGDYWMLSKFDSVIVASTYLIGADPDVTNRFHSRSISAQGGSGSNNAQYANAEVDALLDRGNRIFDPEDRRPVYFRIQELIRNDLPFLPLFQNTTVQGHKTGIEGVRPNINTRTESWNASHWYWDK